MYSMRVIDPRQYKEPKKKSAKRIKSKFLVAVLVLSIPVVFLGYTISGQKDEESNSDVMADTQIKYVDIESTKNEEPPKSSSEFTGNEFRLLYDNLLLDNTDKINEPPTITGNDIADARIRQIAETRGYKIRVEANAPLPIVAGFRLQESLRQPWAEMQQAAINDGINMSIVSGYRTVDDQRELFISRLIARGVNIDEVAAGLADEQVNTVLIESSIPGYSKHHSGYTIDLLCRGYTFEDFKNSTCNDWLVKDNYANARKFGFIPSYPEDADLQGPDPEAWEYVYVGVDALNPN